MISYLQVDNLSKRFGEQLLFENISFGIGKGQKVALIAKNGMGKSTLLRIIAGKDTSESGTVIFRNDITVGILDQDPALDPENSVFEEVFHSDSPVLKLIKAYEEAVAHNHTEALEKLIPEMDIHSAWDYDTTIKQILSELKIDTYDKKIGQLSGGHLAELRSAAGAGLDLCSGQAVLPDERHGAKIGGGRRVRVPPRTASTAGQEKGGAHRPGIGADLRHLGYHRPQHRRQDGHPENGWPAHPHGSVRPAYTGR